MMELKAGFLHYFSEVSQEELFYASVSVRCEMKISLNRRKTTETLSV
jgi:hypothetical protein